MMRDIGKNIRELRLRAGFSQDELAERLFVTRQTVSNYENGRTRPDVEQILHLAEFAPHPGGCGRMWSKFCIWRKSSVRMPTPCSTVRRCRKAGGVLSAALLLAAV